MFRRILLIFVIATISAALYPAADARELVILQTNDTHSQIDPTDKGFGGVQRRKVFIDSVRSAQPNTLLVDAGDAVQGTLFFTLYGGRTEMEVMNHLGYDMQILGNHDFDNGIDSLARNISLSKADWLSANYQFADPKLAKRFLPYKVYDIDGKRIGFFGINLEPKGMIAEGNYDGVKYLDGIDAANATAWWLKHREGADVVVAVTHVGYDKSAPPTDLDLVHKSKDIDIVLGGHSHTLIKPASGKEWVLNAAGDSVLVTQNAKSGEYISEVTIDLDSLGSKLPSLRQVRLGKSYDRSFDPALEAIIRPYRKGVDDLMGKVIGKSSKELLNTEPCLLNFISDFVDHRGSQLAGHPVDAALMNVGSLRRSLPKGNITQGQIISMQPFANKIVVLELSGRDLIDAMEVYASRDGDGVSHQLDVTFDPDTHKVTSLLLNGKKINPDQTYTVATIDYLAHGGDYMTPLTRGKEIAVSDNIVYDDLISYIRSLRKPINPPCNLRFRPAAR